MDKSFKAGKVFSHGYGVERLAGLATELLSEVHDLQDQLTNFAA